MNACAIARTYIGLRETNGHNRSATIDMFNRFTGVAMASPYCASGLSFCFHKAELESPDDLRKKILKSASSQAFKRWAKKEGIYFEDPQKLLKCKGAIAGWTNVGDPDHGHLFLPEKRFTNLVTKKLTSIGTIEFNTNGGGSRDGDGCWELRRKVPVDRGHKLWFIDVSQFVGGQWWP